MRTPTEVGAAIRARRRALGMDQASLARAVGVSRQWIIGVEKGRARAELGLVLRTLEVLGLHIRSDDAPPDPNPGPPLLPPIHLDTILEIVTRRNRD